LVTNDGITSIAAAAAGAMPMPSRPMATVGNPMPVTPLTSPAARKVSVNMSRKKGDSFMP